LKISGELPSGAEVTVHFDEGIRSIAGDLGSQEMNFPFSTAAEFYLKSSSPSFHEKVWELHTLIFLVLYPKKISFF
jgi:hypothetical protein